jgi:hypothetical protein
MSEVIEPNPPDTPEPPPWLSRPGGAARYEKELAFLRQQLNPARLETYVNQAHEVIFELELAQRPGLTYYLKTGVQYPFTEPDLIVEDEGEMLAVDSPTLRNWSATRALYEVCLDAEPLEPPERKPHPLKRLGRLLAVAVLVLLLVIIGVEAFLLISNMGKEAGPLPGVIVGGTGDSGAHATGQTVQAVLPYSLNLKVSLSQAEYQNVLAANQQDAALSNKYRLMIILSQPTQTRLSLRFINQTTGRVRSVNLPEKANSLLLDPTDLGLQTGDSCEFVLTGLDGVDEYSEPTVVSRFSLERFYQLTVSSSR